MLGLAPAEGWTGRLTDAFPEERKTLSRGPLSGVVEMTPLRHPPSSDNGIGVMETGMGLTLWFRCPVAGCSYKRAIRLEPGEAADQSGFARREAALRDEHPNHPVTRTTNGEAEEASSSA
jgi:hypothetical protein